MKLKIDLCNITNQYINKYPSIEDTDIKRFCMSHFLKYLNNRLVMYHVFNIPFKNQDWYDIPKTYGDDLKTAFKEMKLAIIISASSIFKTLVQNTKIDFLFAKFDNLHIDGDKYELDFHYDHNVECAKVLEFAITDKYLDIVNEVNSKEDRLRLPNFTSSSFWYLISKVLTEEFRKRAPVYANFENSLLLETVETKYEEDLVDLIQTKIINETSILAEICGKEDFTHANCVRFIPIVDGYNDISTVYLYCVSYNLRHELPQNDQQHIEIKPTLTTK